MAKKQQPRKSKRALLTLVAVTMIWFSLCVGAPVDGNKTSAACSLMPVITYYTDSSMTVVCGVWDLCSGTYPACWTDYTTRTRKPCCNPQ